MSALLLNKPFPDGFRTGHNDFDKVFFLYGFYPIKSNSSSLFYRKLINWLGRMHVIKIFYNLIPRPLIFNPGCKESYSIHLNDIFSDSQTIKLGFNCTRSTYVWVLDVSQRLVAIRYVVATEVYGVSESIL